MRFLRPLTIVVLAFAISVPAGTGGKARAQESIATGTPTAEQAARCAAIENERARKNCSVVYSVPGLKFPDRAETATEAELRMAIFKPAGSGPFPAVVLLHSCAGFSRFTNIAHWGSVFLKAGYAVFIVDSWGQRGLSDGICKPTPTFPVNAALLRVRDAYEALDHLARFDFVDKARVAALGTSQGARTIYLLSSPRMARAYSPSGLRFAALAALYGECFNRKTRFEFVPNDPDRPLLALLGGKDEDGDPAECLPRFESRKAAGAPFEWHVFPDAGHSWDDSSFRLPRYIPYFAATSGKVFMAYDPDVTAESHRRVLAFLAEKMPKR